MKNNFNRNIFMDSTEKTKDNLFLLLIIAIAAAGIIFRFDGLQFRSLEYDEIWTCVNYAPASLTQIFTDLSTPNNHPLNTLFIQKSVNWFGDDFGFIRLPVFLFGIATLLLSIFLSWKAIKRKDAVIFTTACIAFNGYLIHYSQTARGYSIQTFFVLLTAAALYWLSKHGKSVFYGSLFLFAAICSCLTITSGLIFVCALCGAFIAARFRKTEFKTLCKENLSFIISAFLFLVFAGVWYGMNYKVISAGQTFGTSVIHPWAFLKFFSEMMFKLMLIPFAVIHVIVLFIKKHPRKRVSVFALVFLGLTFLSALVTKAGFDRVYLPVFPVMTITSAMILPGIFFAFKKEKLTSLCFFILAFLIALPMNYVRKKQLPPDYIPLMKEISENVGKDILVNFTPHDSYPMRYNVPESAQDYLQRISSPVLRGFVQVNPQGGISVYEPRSGNTAVLKSPAGPVNHFISESGTGMELYELTPLSLKDNPEGKMLLLTMTPHPRQLFLTFFQPMAASEQWYLANLFLTSQLVSPTGAPMNSGAYLCPAAAHKAEYYLNISRNTGLNWRFYLVK